MRIRPHSRFIASLAAGALFLVLAGSALADFGPLGPDCEALGRGGAYSADAEGPAALYWNPAGLGRLRGIRGVLSYGMLQRPDVGTDDFGSTDRLFLGVSIAPKNAEGLLGAAGFGISYQKPFPRFDYAGTTLASGEGGGVPARVSASASQDYQELLFGLGLEAFRTKVANRDITLEAGLSLGLGISSNSVQVSWVPLAAPGLAQSDRVEGSSLFLPVSLGAAMSIRLEPALVRFAVRYRGVMALSDSEWFASGDGFRLTDQDLFMPPPQEGALAVSALFFERLLGSLELGYYFFDGPDAFANEVPHNYPVIKFGFEYRVPFAKNKNELAARFGLSRSFFDSDNHANVYTSESLGLYWGWGLNFDRLGRVDFYFTLQMPGRGEVEGNTFLASVSYAFSF